MTLFAIVAATADGTIGRDGDMPWHLGSDLRRFKQITMGAPILMGRKTFDSIGRVLPGRRNIVITRDGSWHHSGVDVVDSPRAAIDATKNENAFIIGGAQVYQALLPQCDRIYLTRVCSQIEGDTKIDLDLNWNAWCCRYVERIPMTINDSAPTEFSIWQRLTGAF